MPRQFDRECRAAKCAFSAAGRRDVISTDSSSYDAVDAVAKADAAKMAWYNQRRSYRQLRHIKFAEFWGIKLEANQSDPHKLCRKLVDEGLLGRGRVSARSTINVEVFSRFFAEKVAKVRSSTADTPALTFTRATPGVSFR